MSAVPFDVRGRSLLVVDAATLSTATGVALALSGPLNAFAVGNAAAIVAGLLGFLWLAGGYAPGGWRPRRAAGLRALVLAVATASFLMALPSMEMASRWRLAGGAFGGLALTTVPLAAAAWLRIRRRGWLGGRVLVIGSGPLAEQLAAGVRGYERLGLHLVGNVSERPPGEDGEATGLTPWLGPIEHLEKVLREFAVGHVVVAADEREIAPVQDALVAARLDGIVVESGADCFEWLYERLPLEAPRRQLFLEGPGFAPSRVFELAKRAADVALAVVGLLLSAPIIALAALAIKLESTGPVFFRQVRLGRHGRPFALWKLRSMRQCAEDTGPALAEREDPRVTRVGRLLRRARIDEIPQLWNVLRGEMSIVGPRPERPEFYDELVGRYPLFRHRLAVRPGVTGWAQVQQGYVNDWEGFGIKLSYDLFYLKRRGLALEAKVLWRTAWEMLRLKGV